MELANGANPLLQLGMPPRVTFTLAWRTALLILPPQRYRSVKPYTDHERHAMLMAEWSRE